MVGHLLGHYHCYLYYLEGSSIFEKIALKSAHLPALLLIVGYPVFWLEMYVFQSRMGQTSLTAVVIFLILSLWYVRRDARSASPFLDGPALKEASIPPSARFLLGLSGLATLFILCCVFYALLYPPHLIQEWDAIHYHITLPRQHLILGSFKFIPWAADDLFLLPIQFALAPYWFATTLPNKFPQFIFVLGMIFVSINLVNYLRVNNSLSTLLIVFAILGSHHIGIQMGTAMLDIVICYLFLAALDNFLRGKVFMASVEFAFFFWAKPAIPIQMICIVILTFIIIIFLRKMGWKVFKWGFSQNIDSILKAKYLKIFKKTFLYFILLSIFIGGPFIAKSIYYAGTPLFPFSPGIAPVQSINKNIDYTSRNWGSLLKSSQTWTEADNRNRYGYGNERTLLNFLKHLWLIAVPEKDVNNRFDYPVGLIYLIFLPPFLYMGFRDFKKKEFGLIPVLIGVCWFLWWMGPQEARYLYIPTILMLIVVIPEIRSYSSILLGVVFIALALNALSIFRTHKKDFGLSAKEVLRAKDLEIIKMNQEYMGKGKKDVVDLEFHDVAFARFPVRVTKESLPHTLAL